MKSFCPGKPAWHAKVDPGRCFTQSPQCWFSHGMAHILFVMKYCLLSLDLNRALD